MKAIEDLRKGVELHTYRLEAHTALRKLHEAGGLTEDQYIRCVRALYGYDA